MSAYIEATPRTRQLFFLSVILLGGFALFLDRLETLLPPVSEAPEVAIDQLLYRSAIAALFVSVFYIALSVLVIHYAMRTAESGQWPPKGMTVPFRTKVLKIKKKYYVWIYSGTLLCMFALQATLPWTKYAIQKEQLEKLQHMMQEMPNRALKMDAYYATLHLHLLSLRWAPLGTRS